MPLIVWHHRLRCCYLRCLIIRAIARLPILATGEGFATPAAGFQTGSKESRAFDQQPMLVTPGGISGPRSVSHICYLPIVGIALATR